MSSLSRNPRLVRIQGWILAAEHVRPFPGRAVVAPGLLSVLAASVFLWRLGGSSFFIDEELSVNESSGSLGHLLSMVSWQETTPPTYQLFLHAWLRLFGSTSEFAVRLPSVLAAVALVVAIWYLARLLTDARTAFLVGLLAICSPLVLEYAQQARTYAMLMLAATVAVIAAIKAVNQASVKWLGTSWLFGVATVWLHYTGWLVIGPLMMWVVVRETLTRRAKVTYAVALVVAGLVWLPEAVAQFTRWGNGGVGGDATLSPGHALSVVAAPLYGRATVGLFAQIVIVLLVAILALPAGRWARSPVRGRGLILAVATMPPIVLLALGLAGKDILIPRYAAVATPFLIIAAGGAFRGLRPLPAAVVGIAVLALIVSGLIASASPANDYPDTRAVASTIERQWKTTDFVYPDQLRIGPYETLAYYTDVLLPAPAFRLPAGGVRMPGGVTRPVLVPAVEAGYRRAKAEGSRLWIVSDQNVLGVRVPPRYRSIEAFDFPGVTRLRLVLAVSVGPKRRNA